MSGLDIKAQEAALRLNPDIVVATPGRLIDHLHNAPNFSLYNIEVLVLDEADRMLEEAFADQMKELIRLCSNNRQTMLFSATMTDQINDLASMSLKNPVKIFLNENTETALNLRQEFIRIRAEHEDEREVIVAALITRTFPDHSIIFVRTKKDCQRMNIILGLLGVKIGQLHSSLSQAQRVETLAKFKNAELDVLVSTDLAARGLDIEGVLTVINMHMPMTYKQYVHRVGRTARAHRAGRSISLVGENERKILKEIIAANQGKSMKQRLIDVDVIAAYSKRIAGMSESIKKVEEEERVERELRIAEAELKRGEEKLNGEVKPRRWFQPESKKSKHKGLKEKKAKGASKNQKKELSPEEARAQRLADYQIREAKRMRKGKKIRAFDEGDNMSKSSTTKKKKKQKHKSSFTSQLTSVGKSSVVKFRHGPSDPDFRKAKVMHKKSSKGKN
uniref:ATP-dependent RNA helicase DDX27 n=1 Tax=Syphacia muris TaxID=451379 RepID=A0A0N5AAM4_9BILA